MLSIGKIAATPTAGLYYVEQVFQGVEDYYADEGEMPGVWAGAGADSLSQPRRTPRPGPSRRSRDIDIGLGL